MIRHLLLFYVSLLVFADWEEGLGKAFIVF